MVLARAGRGYLLGVLLRGEMGLGGRYWGVLVTHKSEDKKGSVTKR